MVTRTDVHLGRDSKFEQHIAVGHIRRHACPARVDRTEYATSITRSEIDKTGIEVEDCADFESNRIVKRKEFSMRIIAKFIVSVALFARAAVAAEISPDLIRDVLVASFSSIDSNSQTQFALSSAADGLRELGEAEIAVVVPADLLITHVQRSLSKTEIISDLQLGLEEGRFAFSARANLAEGDITLVALVSGTLSLQISEQSLVLLPALHEIDVEDFSIGGGLQGALLEAAARTALSGAPGRISAILSRFIDSIPLKFDMFEIDLAAELKSHETVRSAEGPKLELSVTPESPVLFVAPEAVYILARMPGSGPRISGERPEANYSAVRAALLPKLRNLAGEQIDSGGLAVRKRAMAAYLNAALPGERPVVRAEIVSVEPVTNHFQEKIELAGRPDFTCKPTRHCSAGACSSARNCTQTRDCSQPHDTRNCSACILRNPFGGCSIRGNDPICEAQKATQNAAYAAAKGACEAAKETARVTCEAQKASEIATCEAREAAKKFDCERLKVQEVAECEAKRALQDLLAEFGGVGSIAADLSLTYRADVAILDFAFTPELGVKAEANVMATASIRGPVSFTPYDLAGHILCTSNWRRDLALDATTQSTNLNLAAGMSSDDGQPALVVSSQPVTVVATSRPPLREFLDRHPDLRVICSGLNLVDLANDAVKQVTGEAVHSILGGRYEMELPQLEIAAPLEELYFDLEDQRIRLNPADMPQSLTYTIAR